MPWEIGHIRVHHLREPWLAADDTPIFVHCSLSELKGTSHSLRRQRHTLEAAYRAAKTEFDAGAALEIVERCVSDAVIDELASRVFHAGRVPRILFPHPAFDDEDSVGHQEPIRDLPTNAIPLAYARYLAHILGCEVEEGIVQAARVGRTKLSKWARFLWQPTFDGTVRRRQNYLLIDDVLTTGGTFAALRSFIIRNGGNITAVTALAHQSGRHQKFRVASGTLRSLNKLYGKEFEGFWAGAIGHGVECLTEAEGKILIQFARDLAQRSTGRAGEEPMQRLRAQLDQAAAKGW
jgi:hypothetical protein